MRWKPGKRSADIEDRRGAGWGFGGGMPIPMGRLGGGGIVGIIVLAIVYLLFISGGGGGGFNVPDPTNAFPQVPQTGTGNNSVPGSPSESSATGPFYCPLRIGPVNGSWDTWSGHAVSVLWERES